MEIPIILTKIIHKNEYSVYKKMYNEINIEIIKGNTANIEE